MTPRSRSLAVRGDAFVHRPPGRTAWGALAGAAVVLLSAGCYGPMYQQQPYGYQSYPGAQPGAPYYQGSPGYPGATLGNPTYDSAAPGGAPGGGNAPPYGSPTSSTGNRPVPEYDDAAFGTKPPYYSDPGTQTGSRPGVWSAPDSGAPAGDEDFQQPIPGKPISFAREVTAVESTPYAHDAAGHRWLQGVVSFDEREKSWGIVYSISPDPADPHAGYLTLAEDARLATLKNGDLVRLDGRVDPGRLDQYDRATYVVSTLTPLSH